jgi:hypothetical protein
MNTTAAAAITALALTASAGLAQTSTWNITSDGFWTVPTNWTPVSAPTTATSNAIIPNNGTYTIRVSSNISTNDITNNNPSAIIALDAGRQHDLFGDLDNDGVYLINQTGGAATTSAIWDNSATFSGTGSIQLNGFANRSRLIADTGATLTNGSTHRITGFGQIFGNFINNGLIDANVPFNTLDFRFGNVTNNGVIRATNDGILELNLIDLIITQGPSGVIRADDAEVSLTAPTIIGGTVEGINGGTVIADSNPTLDDVTLNGDVQIVAGQRLNLVDTITNNGTLLVNINNGAAATSLDADNNVLVTGSGTITLNGFSNRAQITTDGGGTFTNDSGHTIEGYGRIFGTFDNDGLVTANAPGLALILITNDKSNSGTISADSGIVEISNCTLDQTGGGTIAANTSNATYSAVSLLGGTLTSGTGYHEVLFSSVFDAVDNQGEIRVQAGDSLQITGSINNDGEIIVNPTNGAAQTFLQFNESGALNGSGTLTLSGFSTRSQLSTIDPLTVTVTNTANHTIHGYGRIIAPIVNDGQIIADVSGQELLVVAVEIQNNNTIQATNDAILELSTGSSVTQAPGAKIAADDALIELRSASITGGTLESSGTGLFNATLGGATLTDVTNNAHFEVSAAQTLVLDSTHTNNNLIDVNPTNGAAITSLQLMNSMTLDGTGEIRLSGLTSRAQITGATDTETLTLGADQTLSGIGNLEIDLVNNGTIAPGLSVGTINAFDDITMGASGVYECEVAADNNADRINMPSGAFNAGGTLDVSFIGGFNPAGIWTAQIVNASDGVTGTFDTVNAPSSANPFLTFRVGYFPNEIRIGFVCDADFDLSGELDFFDISRFLTLFNNGQPAADITGDGEYDFFDISAFLQLFTNGCADG